MTRGRVVIAGVATALAVTGCAGKEPHANLLNGKQKFTDQCAQCHSLARANATGVVGPNLDAAFARSRVDGLGQSTIQGIVNDWIRHPNRNPQMDPLKGTPTAQMPAGIYQGQDARDVAAYVASAVAKPGKDAGRLAGVGAQKAQGTATEKSGTLDIPVAQSGLAFKFADATAQPGNVKITSENPQTTGHNIAIEGPGVDQKGEVVTKATSTVTADLKPGTYTFLCTIPGHAEGGMKGTLTVK
jgi:plastocyanin